MKKSVNSPVVPSLLLTIILVVGGASLSSAALAAGPSPNIDSSSSGSQYNSALGGMVESSTATSDAAGLSKEGGQTDDIRVVVARIINNFLALLGILAIGLIIYAGFLWMTAGGNEEQISKAKKMILNATIGLFIILASFSISAFVINSIQQSSIAGGPTESSFCFSCMLW